MENIRKQVLKHYLLNSKNIVPELKKFASELADPTKDAILDQLILSYSTK